MKIKHLPILFFLVVPLIIPAVADIVYSDLKNIPIPTTYDGVYLNLLTGETGFSDDSPPGGWGLNATKGGLGLYNSPNLQPVRNADSSIAPVVSFTLPGMIHSGLLFTTEYSGVGYGVSDAHVGTTFTSGTETYLGFRLDTNNDSLAPAWKYGWMRVVLFDNIGRVGMIKDWAYDNAGGAIATGNIQQSGSILTLDSSFGSFTLGSALTDGISVIKTGSGTTTISRMNTYTGTTTVSAGVLAVDGSLANTATTVGAAAILRGSGSIGGSVTIQSGGVLAAGDRVQSLATGTLSLQSLSNFAYESDSDAAADMAGDLISITGDLSLDVGNLAILSLIELGSGIWNVGDKLTLISYTGNWNGGVFNDDGPIFDDSSLVYMGMLWTFNYNDAAAGTNFLGDLTGSRFVTMTAIPEFHAALLGSLGLFALLLRRR